MKAEGVKAADYFFLSPEKGSKGTFMRMVLATE